MEYYFEEVQLLKFVVYDIDDPRHIDDKNKHDLIGELECTLADVVAAGQQYKRNLRDKGEPACCHKLHVTFDHLSVCRFTKGSDHDCG
jgi:hypothetical protein